MLLLTSNCEELINDNSDIIQHVGIAQIVDIGHAIAHDHCSVDFFEHNESYTGDVENEEPHRQTYFFVSWTTLNELEYSEVVGNIYNVRNPYLPIADLNNSFLPIISHKTPEGYQQNYHYISTSDFRSKPDDIIFSFYNEYAIEIRVFGASKSNFQKDSLLWSPQIPITGKTNNDSKYNIRHQNIQCIDGNLTEFILFVYEEIYFRNDTHQLTNIYKSTFNNLYVVTNDMDPVNTIEGFISHPLVHQSLISNHIIITYIANYVSIYYKLYTMDHNDNLVQISDESAIVSIQIQKTIKYYNIIPLSVGGYILMYSVTNSYENNPSDEIYIVLMDENGNNLFNDENDHDIFIEYESNNTYAHGQIIELREISETETYVLITFARFESERDKLMGIVYYINIDTNAPIFNEIGDIIEMKSFPNAIGITDTKDRIRPNFQCINYDKTSNLIVIGWINNYHSFAYKPFYFHLPTNNNNNNNNRNIYNVTKTTEFESSENNNNNNTINTVIDTTMDTTIDNFNDDKHKKESELITNNKNGLSKDMQIVVIVLCVSGFYCLLIIGITFGIIYMVNTGKLRFAIGYKQIHKQNKNKFEAEESDELELENDDKGGIFADDEQTVDEEQNDDIIVTHKKNKGKKKNNAKSKVEIIKLMDESD